MFAQSPPVRRRGERGQALAFIGIAMVALTGFAVVGIDVARLAFTAAEVQSIADVAATAAGGALGAHENNPLATAIKVVRENYVDGRKGIVGASANGVLITPGVWTFDSGKFTASTWNDPTVNAVRARASARVDNFVAGIFGAARSDVVREATVAAGGACSMVGTLPIAIEQDAIQKFMDSGNCSNVPPTRLFQTPTDNSCFTSLSASTASSDVVRSYVPKCGSKSGAGDGKTQQLTIGQVINLNNGQDSSVLQAIDDCLQLNPPLNEFVVPVVPDGACGPHSANIVAFARIIIDHVEISNSSGKGVYIKGVCRDAVSGENPGCLSAGENAIALVN